MKSGAVKYNHTSVKQRFTVRDTTRGGRGKYARKSHATHCWNTMPVAWRKKKAGALQGFVFGTEVRLPEACKIPDCKKEMRIASREASRVPFFRYPSRKRYVTGAANCMRNV